MPELKCLHIITGLSAGGAQQALYNLLSGGLANCFQSSVVSLSDEGVFGPRFNEIGVPVAFLRMPRGLPSIGGVLALRRLVREMAPDVVQGWMYHGNLAASLAARMTQSRPAMFWNVRHCLYGLEGERVMTRQVIRANRFLSSRPDCILYNSRLSREQHEAFGFCDSNGQIIPNGFDLDRFSPSEDNSHSFRDSLGIPRTARVVGHIGRFHPMKDHAGFVRAAVGVLEKEKNVHFVLCGKEVDRDNLALVEVVPEAMRDKFHWLGERNDIPDIMRAIDIFCQSSWSEAFPNVLGEAMATQVPCVATQVGDSVTVVGDTGLIVPPRNLEELTHALVKMITMPSVDLRALGLAARRRVKEKYSLGAVVEQYATLYARSGQYRKGVN